MASSRSQILSALLQSNGILAFFQGTLAATVAIAATVAVILDKVSGDAYMGLLSAITFYVLGHGGAISAANGAMGRIERKVEETRDEVKSNHSS